jgi:membrane dipeptidase
MGAAIMLSLLAAWAIDEADPKVARIVGTTNGIDAHNHIDVPLTAAEVPGSQNRLGRRVKRSDLSVICMTYAGDCQKIGNAAVADAMLKTDFTADEIGKVGGGNYGRVCGAATAA